MHNNEVQTWDLSSHLRKRTSPVFCIYFYVPWKYYPLSSALCSSLHSYKRSVFMTYMCTKYIVQFCLSFIKLLYTYTHTYIYAS